MKLPKRMVSRPSGINKNYLKIKDGQSIGVVFRGAAHEFWQIWPFGGEKQVFSKKTPGSSSKFRMNVIVHEGGKFVAKLWEFPPKVYDQIVSLQDDFPLHSTKFKVTRHGSDKSTTYTIFPSLKEPLTEKALKEIGAVPLNMLEDQPPHEPEESVTPEDDESEYP